MSACTEVLRHDEARVVWFEDPESLRFVRAGWVLTRSRTAPVEYRGTNGRALGYAELRDDAPSLDRRRQCFFRRVFWIEEQDEEPTYTPSEAIDPRRLRRNCARGIREEPKQC